MEDRNAFHCPPHSRARDAPRVRDKVPRRGDIGLREPGSRRRNHPLAEGACPSPPAQAGGRLGAGRRGESAPARGALPDWQDGAVRIGAERPGRVAPPPARWTCARTACRRWTWARATAPSARACASPTLEVRPGAVLTLGTTELKLVPEEGATRTLPLSVARALRGAGGQRAAGCARSSPLLERVAPGRVRRAHPGRDGHRQGAVRGGAAPGERAHQGPLRHRGPGGRRAPRSWSRSCSGT